ncbi:MAG: class I SAM-dependent methyltransferase [Synergistaceae bacterium]|nr:class I SAM-dependent methyltransferase [Synergistaceae bacterium]
MAQIIMDSGLRTNYARVKFEDCEHEYLDEIYSKVASYSEMSRNERYFLNGIVRFLKPAKILEVGVASGGGSSIILNAIRDLPNSQLISADYCEKYYGGQTERLSGWLVDEEFPHLKGKWTIYSGGDISRYIERVGGDIDLLVLDTAHIHPWETLNFLCVLPYMKAGSWCVLHDVSLPYLPGREDDLACRYLYGHVATDCRIMPAPDEGYIPHFSNIGAFHITEDTVKYSGGLFDSLLCPWMALPGVFDKRVFPCATPMLPQDLDDIRAIIRRHYPERAGFFEHAVEFQEGIARHKTEHYRSFNGTWERNFPISYRLVKAVKGLCRRMKTRLRRYVERNFPALFTRLRRWKHRNK